MNKEIDCRDCKWHNEEGCNNVNAISKETCYESYEDDYYDDDMLDTQSIFFVVVVVLLFVALVVTGVYLILV